MVVVATRPHSRSQDENWKAPMWHQKVIKYLRFQWRPLSWLPAESLCLTLRLTLTALNMQGQFCQTDLWIPNSPESCSIFHWSWIFKKINPLKTYKTYRSGALCPKNKIASAISHYRQPHQPPSLNYFPLSVPLAHWQNPSGNQAVSINKGSALLFQTAAHFLLLTLSHLLPFPPPTFWSSQIPFFLLFVLWRSPWAVLHPHKESHRQAFRDDSWPFSFHVRIETGVAS